MASAPPWQADHSNSPPWQAERRNSPPWQSDGRPLRITDPSIASSGDFAVLDGLLDAKADLKLAAIRKGAKLMRELQPFPNKRRCKDVVWAVVFVIAAAAALGLPFLYTRDLYSEVVNAIAASSLLVEMLGKAVLSDTAGLNVAAHTFSSGQFTLPTDDSLAIVWRVLVAAASGAVGSIIFALLYVRILHSRACHFLQLTLLLVPFLSLSIFLACCLYGAYLIYFLQDGAVAVMYFSVGGIFGLVSFCTGRTLCLYWRRVPFTVQLVRSITEVIFEHPSIITVSIFGSAVPLLWACSCVFVGAGIILERKDTWLQYVTYGVWLLVFAWGGLVTSNVVTVAQYGVFSRCYSQQCLSYSGGSVCPSLGVAMSTSFGSVCKASLSVPFILTLVFVAKRVQDSAEEGNCVMRCIFRIVRGALNHIEEPECLEYVNSWAYMQCAVRNASFMEAAEITHSICSCANVMYLMQDLLIGWISGLGRIIAAICGLGVGAGTGYVLAGRNGASSGAILGFVAALLTGGAIAAVFSTGTKAIVVLWAEDAEPMMREHTELHDAFEEKVGSRLRLGGTWCSSTPRSARGALV